jgi:replication factor C subunit 1
MIPIETTTAHLVAREAGRDVIEFNASDVRSKSALQDGLGDITGSRTIEFNVSKSGRPAAPKPRTKRCIIMDEVDGMGGGDRGGIASLIQLIKNSHVPIICICNDRQAQKIRSLVDYCLDLRFRRPTKVQLAKRAVEIAAREGLLVEPNAAEAIAESCGNDVRQVINALQMWNKSSGGDGTRMTYKQLKDRQHEINKDEILRLGLFDATRTILEGRKGLGNSDPKAERDNFYKRDEAFYVDYNFVGLMVQQNYLRVVQNDFSQTVRTKNDDEGVKVLERMSAAADSMSDFDLVSTTIMRSQNWTLLPFSSICAVKTGFHASGPTGSFFPGYPEFTSYLGRNSTKTKKSRLLQEIQYHANYHVSGGTHELRMTYLPAFRDRFLALLKGSGSESGGSDNVNETIDLMDAYGLDRDDVMEKFDEFNMDPKAETFAKIESKRKAAFTRAYNERAHTSQALVTEQLGAVKKTKRGAAASSASMSETKDPDVIDEDEAVEEEDEQGDDDDDDDAEKIRNLFKPSRKGKSAAASKSGAAKGGAAGKGGRGKAKK